MLFSYVLASQTGTIRINHQVVESILLLIQVRQIRNTLSTSDWLFLNACLGIINDDESALKAYLRQDGDRARQLTKDECLVLGQPSVFTVGSTLVHLAIRYAYLMEQANHN